MIQYQYETSPRKLKTTPRKKKKTSYKPKVIKSKKRNVKVKDKPNIIFILGIVLTMLFIIIYRNAMINESFSKLQALKRETTALQKENEQLEVNIQNSINLNNIETAAKEQLGMQKLTSSQTEYISLDKQDYVEATAEAVVLDEDTNLITQLKNKIMNIF